MRNGGIRRWIPVLTLALVVLAGGAPVWAAVQRFVDDKGVIHITNKPSGSSGGKEAERVGPGPAVKPTPPGEPHEPPPLPEQPLRKEKPLPPQSVNRFVDERGVIHITNLLSAPREPRHIDLAAARISDRGEILQELGRELLPPNLNGPLRHAAPDSHRLTSGSAAASPRPLGALAKRAAQVSAGGPAALSRPPVPETAPVSLSGKSAVRRFRDKRGVLHITNLAPGPPGGRPLPAINTASLQEGHQAIPLAMGPVPPPPRPGVQGDGQTGRRPPKGRLMVRRDRQGRLVITNVPPRAPARALWARNGAPDRSWLTPIVAEASRLYRLPAALIEALIKVESNYVPWAVSPKGAMGLMQLMPQTASFLGVSDPFSPRENVLGGSRYFRLLLDYFNQSLPLALAAYNAGHQRVVAAGYQVPRIKETQAFVGIVLDHYYARLEPALHPGL
ncbi:MAG: lytic transglycosylase domain-containing protein [Deltaproteobacteria bacterium]|nr:lytic transglycosylase domain-containing protein [Deltaproteobacteria bacterium]